MSTISIRSTYERNYKLTATRWFAENSRFIMKLVLQRAACFISRPGKSRFFSRSLSRGRALHNLLGVPFAVAHRILKIRKILLAFISGWLTRIRGLHRLQREKLSSTTHTAKTSRNELANLAQSALSLWLSLLPYFLHKFSPYIIGLFRNNVISFLK